MIRLRPVAVCNLCQYEWLPQIPEFPAVLPVLCPNCRRRTWNGKTDKRLANQKQERRDQIADW